MENVLKPIKIKVFYNENLKKITGKDFEEIMVSEGLGFAQSLYFLFSSYPEITKKFSPGKLGFLLNGKKPTEYDVLKDGDELKLVGIE
ncbi:MoaD/ThiS family protein [Candidatus Parcubacteria bacterium]|nr:MoaD/ThiS family protein [Candidatus Parcubacteria bacterium]